MTLRFNDECMVTWSATRMISPLVNLLDRDDLKLDRRKRLCAVACCLLDGDFPPMTSRERCLFDAAELFADGKISGETLSKIDREMGDPMGHIHPHLPFNARWLAHASAHRSLQQALLHRKRRPGDATNPLFHLIRDTFGNPFAPFPVLKPEWRTRDVLNLAESVYESRNKDRTLDQTRLSILADALEDAGYFEESNQPNRLLHTLRNPLSYRCEVCQGNGYLAAAKSWPRFCWSCASTKSLLVPRYRGFWPLDLVLGKHE